MNATITTPVQPAGTGVKGEASVNPHGLGQSWYAAPEASGVLISEKVPVEIDVSLSRTTDVPSPRCRRGVVVLLELRPYLNGMVNNGLDDLTGLLVSDTAELWIAPVINVGWDRCVGCVTRTRNCPWHSSQWFYAGTTSWRNVRKSSVMTDAIYEGTAMLESAGATAIRPFTLEIPGSTFATPS